MEFNASDECGGGDAWTCLVKRAEDSLAYARVRGRDSEGGGNLEHRAEAESVEGLTRTLLRYLLCYAVCSVCSRCGFGSWWVLI